MRIAVALPWIAFAIAIVAIGGIPFALALVGVAWVAMAELFRITRRYHPLVAVALLAAVALMVAGYYGSQYQIVLIGALTFPALFIASVSRPPREGTTVSIGITLLAIWWIAVPLAHAVLLRDLPFHGGALVIDVLVGTFVTDTAAYAGGRIFGRHPLAPRISPSKTVEGLVAGFVGGTFGFWFAGLYQDWMSGIDALVIGMCVAAVAPIGDLFCSMIKRDLGVKDTGRAFGPHGGLLDRLDALLFTLVAGYYLSVALVY